MGDVAKGIKSFKKGMKDPEHQDQTTSSSRSIKHSKITSNEDQIPRKNNL